MNNKMRHFVRVSFYVAHHKIKGELKLYIGDYPVYNGWCFQTLWLNGKLIEWNLGGIKPTVTNIKRLDARIVIYMRNLLDQANIYPKVLWEHLLQ